MSDQHVTIKLADGTDLPAYTAQPQGPGPHPGLMVLQEAFGVNEHIRDVTRRFADQGYIAVAPELFHRTAPGIEIPYAKFDEVRPHMQAMTTEGVIADLNGAYKWLQEQPSIRKDRIAAVGFCLGGRTALTANAVLPLYAAVSFYGGVSPLLKDSAADLSGRMLLFWGLLDKHLGPDVRATVVNALTEAGKTFTNVEISDADHGFFCDARASYNASAARDAWALTLEFLRR